MKSFAALCTCVLAVGLSAQTTRTFTSPDGTFQFKYSQNLVDCMPVITTGKASPEVVDACASQGGLCGSYASTIACFGYPKEKLKDKPSFTAASFFVAEVPDAKTEKDCLEQSQYWALDKTRTESIHGVQFKVFEVGDNWAGGSQWGPIYRTFHGGKCYELGRQTSMVHGGYDEDVLARFTKWDAKEIESKMDQPLHSFKFAK